MVLDALIKIKNELDPTLTFRRSCREGGKSILADVNLHITVPAILNFEKMKSKSSDGLSGRLIVYQLSQVSVARVPWI